MKNKLVCPICGSGDVQLVYRDALVGFSPEFQFPHPRRRCEGCDWDWAYIPSDPPPREAIVAELKERVEAHRAVLVAKPPKRHRRRMMPDDELEHQGRIADALGSRCEPLAGRSPAQAAKEKNDG